MSVRLSVAAIRTYDALKQRPGARPRYSDARDTALIGAIHTRLGELISGYQIGGHDGPGGATYVFWSEIETHIRAGAFDDFLDRL